MSPRQRSLYSICTGIEGEWLPHVHKIAGRIMMVAASRAELSHDNLYTHLHRDVYTPALRRMVLHMNIENRPTCVDILLPNPLERGRSEK
jgi:hypothetical protein